MNNEQIILETINCLKSSFKVTDNELRKQAEARLKELGKQRKLMFRKRLQHAL
jgi:hypothetical protein